MSSTSQTNYNGFAKLPQEIIDHIVAMRVILSFPINVKYHGILFAQRVLPFVKTHNRALATWAIDVYYQQNMFQLTAPCSEIKDILWISTLNPPFAPRIRHLRLELPVQGAFTSAMQLDCTAWKHLFQLGPEPKAAHQGPTTSHRALNIRRFWGNRPDNSESFPHATAWQAKLSSLRSLTIALRFDFDDEFYCFKYTVEYLKENRERVAILMRPKQVEIIPVGSLESEFCECGCIADMSEVITSLVMGKEV